MNRRRFAAALVPSLLLSIAAFAPNVAAQQVRLTQAQALDRVAIEDLLVTYYYFLDNAQSAKLSELFTENGVFHLGSIGEMKGRQAISDYYAKRPTTRVTRHVLTNLMVDFKGADRAETVHTLTYFVGEGPGRHPASPTNVQDYTNTVVRGADGRWLIEHRRPKPPVFSTAQAAPAAAKQ